MAANKKGIKIGQLNCHNSKTATGEVFKLAEEYSLDILLAQEHYHLQELKHHVIEADKSALASVILFNKDITLTFLRHLSNRYCCVVEIVYSGFRFYLVSYYFKFCEAIGPHIAHLSHVIHSLRGQNIIIGTDCNASSPLWCGPSRSSDADRRIAMEEFIAESNLTVHNQPLAPPTYSSPTGESYIDVTLSSGNLSIRSWWVFPEASSSDHRLITFEAGQAEDTAGDTGSGFTYNLSQADWKLFGMLFIGLRKEFTRSDLSPEQCAEQLNLAITYCADTALGRRILKYHSKCDWWNDNLTKHRCFFRSARRKVNMLKRNKQ